MTRTPDLSLGSIRYSFDLSLNARNDLSGWLRLYAKDYYGTWYETEYEDDSEDDLRWNFNNIVQQYYPGSETAEAEFNGGEDGDEPVLQGYFMVRSQSEVESKSFVFSLPHVSWLLPNVGDTADRDTRFRSTKSEGTVEANLKLPAGMALREVPAALNIVKDKYRFQGEWTLSEGLLRARIDIAILSSQILHDEFAEFYEDALSAERWWTSSVSLEMDPAAAASNGSSDSDSFVRLSSAKAQLNLLDTLYPYGENDEKRRECLKLVETWFTEDGWGLYRSGMELVRLDSGTVEPVKLAKRIEALIEYYGSEMDSIYYAWGEYLLGGELEEAGDQDGALELYLKHVGQDDLNPFRVGWAAYRAAYILNERADDRIVEVVWKGIAEDSEALDDLVALLFSYLLREGDEKRIAGQLAKLESAYPSKFISLVTYAGSELVDDGVLDEEKPLAIWEEQVSLLAERFDGLSSIQVELMRTRSNIGLDSRFAQFSKELAKYLKRKGPKWYKYKKGGSQLTEPELHAVILETEETSDWFSQADYLLLYLSSFPENRERFAQYMYWMAWVFAFHKEDAKLEAFFFEHLSTFEPSTDLLCNAHIKYVQYLRERERPLDALSVLENFQSYEGLEEDFRGISHIRAGEILEELGRNEDAIAEYLDGGKYHASNYYIYSGLLRAYFLALEVGDRDSASQLLDIFAAADSADIDELDEVIQIRRIISGAKDRDLLVQYWDTAKSLSDLWDGLGGELGLVLEELPDTLPVIENYETLVTEAKEAAGKDDRFVLFANACHVSRSAYWIPGDALKLAEIVADMSSQEKSKSRLNAALLPLLEWGLEHDVSSDRSLYRRYLAIACYSSQKLEKLEVFARSVLDDERVSSEDKDFVVYYWAMLGVSLEAEERPFIVELEKRLENPEMNRDRGRCAYVLALEYQTDKRFAEATKLIERELKNPHVKRSETFTKSLKELSATIAKTQAVATELRDAVVEWRRSYDFKWWNFVKPKTAKKLSANGVYLHVVSGVGHLSLLEQVKYHLLLIESEELGVRDIGDSLHAAVGLLAKLEGDERNSYDYFDSVLDLDNLDAYSLNVLRIEALSRAIELGDVKKAKRYLGDGEHILEPYRSEYKHIVDFLALQRESIEDWLAAVEFLVSGPMGNLSIAILNEEFYGMVIRGEEEVVEKVTSLLDDADIAGTASISKFQLKLNMRQVVKIVSSFAPVFDVCEEFAKIELKKGKGSRQQPRFSYQPFNDFESSYASSILDYRTPDGALGQINEALNYARSYKGASTWKYVNKMLEFISDNGMSELGEIVSSELMLSVNVDSGEEMKTLLNELKIIGESYPDSSSALFHDYFLFIHKLSRENLRELPSDQFVSNLAKGAHQPLYESILSYYNGDTAKAGELLEKADGEVLSNDLFVGFAYLIARESGNEVLADLLEEALLDAVYEILVGSFQWYGFAWESIMEAAFLLPDEKGRFRWYLEHFEAASANEEVQMLVRMSLAYLDEEWNLVRKLASERLQVEDDLYDLYWYLGKASYELGDLESARKELQVFVANRRGSVRYFHAKRLLDEAAAEELVSN